MNIVPGKDPQEWASFNSRFGLLLRGTPTICFLMVVGGSVYGIQKSIEAQHPGLGILIAVAVALMIQSMNSVSVHFSTRWIASLFMSVTGAGRQMLKSNKNQKIALIDGVIGVFCLVFTISICYFDFRSNKEGSERAADMIVEKPVDSSVDTTTHVAALSMARQSVASAKEAEQAERREFEAKVDREVNAKRSRYADRQAHLNRIRPLPKWAANELAQIRGTLNSMEADRKTRKAEFVAVKSNVAQAQSDMAAISAQNGRMLLSKQILADSTNTVGAARYGEKKEGFTMAMFWLYITFMLLWHLCHGMAQYRALRFDEQHPSNESAIIAIAETIRNGVSNMLWRVKASIMNWMPEDEIHGITRTDLIEKTNTAICEAVYSHILRNSGINEMLIYTHFRADYDPADVRQSLRLLKTARLVFENSNTWTADSSQAAFFGKLHQASFT